MKIIRQIIHRSICFYLRRVGGAFHTYPYGENGRYVVIMNEDQYSDYRNIGVCEHCDGTGDVHSIDGEWAGVCECGAHEEMRTQNERQA